MISWKPGEALRWTFLVPDLPRPAGGLIAVYELANALAAAGTDPVRIVHMPSHEARFRSTSEIPWFTFDSSIEHDFPTSLDPDLLPEADILLYTIKTIAICIAPETGSAGQALVQRLQGPDSAAGLPMLFVQALGVFPADAELLALRGVGPKVCVASWLAENLVRAGLPATEVAHVANGLHEETFRVSRPMADRAPLVAMNFNPHSLKNMDAGIEALSRLDEELDVPSVLFGSEVPAHPLHGRLRFVQSLSQPELAENVYNHASIYLQPSTQEGFGLCAIEAMACGCALVTTDNGGSADYAHDDETAVLCGTEPEAMTEALARLVRDDARRLRIAVAGVEYVKRFRWDRSAAKLRQIAIDYVSVPGRFRSGPRVELTNAIRRLPTGAPRDPNGQ